MTQSVSQKTCSEVSDKGPCRSASWRQRLGGQNPDTKMKGQREAGTTVLAKGTHRGCQHDPLAEIKDPIQKVPVCSVPVPPFQGLPSDLCTPTRWAVSVPRKHLPHVWKTISLEAAPPEGRTLGPRTVLAREQCHLLCS